MNNNKFFLAKKINVFTKIGSKIYIDCNLYKDAGEVMQYLWKYFEMPTYENFSVNAFLDWFRDESYLQKKKYIFILKNFDLAFNNNTDKKRYLLEIFMFYSIYWWKEEVKFFVVGGKPKQVEVIVESEMLEQIVALQILHRFPVNVEKINITGKSNNIDIKYTYYNYTEHKMMECEIKFKNIESYYQVEKTDNRYTQYLISNFYGKTVELEECFLVWLNETNLYCFIKK